MVLFAAGLCGRPGPAEAQPPHPLLWAQGLTDGAVAQLSYADRLTAAQALNSWGYLGKNAPLPITTAGLIAANRRSNHILWEILEEQPDNVGAMLQITRNNFDLGELLPATASTVRMRLYEEMETLARRCTEVAPENPACWHALATGLGRAATTRGVMASAFVANEVENAWTKALELGPKGRTVFGDPISTDIRYGLGVFYRMVPDHWLVRVFLGVRGDKEKSVRLLREAAATQPMRIELQKELGVALLCYGREEDEPKAVSEGREILERIVAGRFDDGSPRFLDPVDRRHAAELLVHPDRACGYSRDGYQDVSDEAVEKQAEKRRP